jgi:protease-4
MDRSRLILGITLVFSFLSVLLGIATIATQTTSSRYSKSTGSGISGILGSKEVRAVLIRIEGEIHSGESTYTSTGAESILRELREIEEDNSVKGILIEINSPGGTVAASQEIYQSLMRLRKSKKIVVSMKDLAASGGYYIAASADHIFAQNGTITGSIGVIAMVPNVKGLMEKYGVEMKTYKAGKYKDMMSMFRPSTLEEDILVDKLLKDTYTQFIEDIAKGRNKAVSTIEDLAEGKIYSGQDAFRSKLVDDIGGRREAHNKLSELCQYEGEIPLIEKEQSPFDRIMKGLGGSFQGSSSKILNQHPMIMAIIPSAISMEIHP